MFANIDLINSNFPTNIFMRISNGIYMSHGIYSLINIDYQGWEDQGWEDHFSNDYVPAYGVADSVEQFIAKFGGFIEKSSDCYAVIFTAVYKNDQPEEDGWRWHKWGEYIGNKNPKCEYLYDEPDINLVYTFHVFRKRVLTNINLPSINLLNRVSEGRFKAFVLR